MLLSPTALDRRFLVLLLGLFAAPISAVVELDAARLDAGPVALDSGWLYQPGDAPTDGAWRPLDDTAGDAGERLPDWTGIGRFRLELDIGPELVGAPLALRLRHPGASELFVDDELLARAGRVDGDAAATRPHDPHGVPTILVFDRPGRHRLTLRYACHAAADPHFGRWLTARQGAGFRLSIDRSNRAITTATRDRLVRLGLNLGLSSLALGFAVFHGLLFLLHRGHRGNLWFALFALALSANGAQEIVRSWLPLGLWHQHTIRLINVPISALLVLSAIGFLAAILPGPAPTAVRWLRWTALPALLTRMVDGLLPVPNIYSLWILASGPVAISLAVSAWRRQVHGSRALAVSATGWGLTMVGEALKSHLGLAFEVLFFAVGLSLVLGGASLLLARRIAVEGRETERLARDLEERVHERTIDLRRSEREARAASRAKSAFLATMSHEIRTPMNAILGFAQLLARADLPIREREMVATLERSASSLLRLIGDILDLSRVEAGRLELEEQAIRLDTLVDEVIDLFALQARDQGLELDSTLDPELPTAMLGDPIRLRQILVNLVGNALKFTTEGRVDLVARRLADDNVVFEVVDTGIGIAPERRRALFQPFVQADGSAVRRHGGAGLGLAICHELATMMGGSVEIDDTPGGGSTFRVHLPLRPADSVDTAELAESAGAEPAARRLSILLAEDNLVNQEVIALMVEDLGHVLDRVDGGEAVFEALDEHDYDVLLLDLHMPDLDGVEVARRLRRSGQSLPIVALTASVLPEDRERCRAVGMDDFLSKPVRMETLRALFDSLPRDTHRPG